MTWTRRPETIGVWALGLMIAMEATLLAAEPTQTKKLFRRRANAQTTAATAATAATTTATTAAAPAPAPVGDASAAKQPVSVVPEPRPLDWWKKRHESMNQRVKQGNVDLVMIGDSITQGWEGAGAAVWKQYYAKRNTVNLGISGDTTQHVLWRLDHGNVEGISPKLAVVMIGTNNTGRGFPAEDTVAGITAVVAKIRAKLPNTKILLLAVFPRDEKPTDAKRTTNAAVNKELPKLADGKNVFFVDIGPKFLTPDGVLAKSIMPDLLHLSPAGYKIWAEAIEPYVAQHVGPLPPAPAAAVPAPRNMDWWKARHESMNARIKQGNADLLMIGDSITQGWEGAGAPVWKEFYGKRNAVNLGIGGDETQHVLWRLDHGNLEGISPKLAVVMIGTNNTGNSKTPPLETAEGVKAIVEKLRAKLPKTKILLLAVFPRDPKADGALRQVNNKVNAAIADAADGRNVFFLDIGAKFLTADGTLTPEIMPDYLHLTEKGYRIWADAVEPIIAKHVGPK